MFTFLIFNFQLSIINFDVAKVRAQKSPHNYSLQRLSIVRECSELFGNVREIKKNATPTWQKTIASVS
jgi:hypothetical protein